jgi:hypothetical protein
MSTKRPMGDFAALGVSEKLGDMRLEESYAWEDKAIDFVTEFGREAGKEVIFCGIICGLNAVRRWRFSRGGLVVFAFAPRHI